MLSTFGAPDTTGGLAGDLVDVRDGVGRTGQVTET